MQSISLIDHESNPTLQFLEPAVDKLESIQHEQLQLKHAEEAFSRKKSTKTQLDQLLQHRKNSMSGLFHQKPPLPGIDRFCQRNVNYFTEDRKQTPLDFAVEETDPALSVSKVETVFGISKKDLTTYEKSFDLESLIEEWNEIVKIEKENKQGVLYSDCEPVHKATVFHQYENKVAESEFKEFHSILKRESIKLDEEV